MKPPVVSPDIEVITASCMTGDGLDRWMERLGKCLVSSRKDPTRDLQGTL